MSARIDQLWPEAAPEVSDADLLTAYAFPPDRAWLRVNFISSIDGAATREGRSGGLGDAADRRVFDLLRWPAHVVMVAAGTVREEGYGAMELSDAATEWRVTNGLQPQPVLVLVTRNLDLDPTSAKFAEAPVRPIIYTTSEAPESRRVELAEVADVVRIGDGEIDLAAMKHDLSRRGHSRIHSEGGPSFFGTLLASSTVDELCLTVAPTLDAGGAPRIAHSSTSVPTHMQLSRVFRARDELLLRYVRS